MRALYFDADPKRIAQIKALCTVWRKTALSHLSPLRYAEVDEPEIPGPNWVKVKNRMCGLCGSDVHCLFMEVDPRVAPTAVPPPPRKFLGHERRERRGRRDQLRPQEARLLARLVPGGEALRHQLPRARGLPGKRDEFLAQNSIALEDHNSWNKRLDKGLRPAHSGRNTVY